MAVGVNGVEADPHLNQPPAARDRTPPSAVVPRGRATDPAGTEEPPGGVPGGSRL